MDGTYVATLVVNNGTNGSEPDSVEIEAEAPPVRSTPEAMELARQVGGDDYMTKPFDSQDLLKRVSVLLEPRSGE